MKRRVVVSHTVQSTWGISKTQVNEVRVTLYVYFWFTSHDCVQLEVIIQVYII